MTNVDHIAERLIMLGQMGRNMPRTWDSDRISIPVCSPDGGFIGRILPGKGYFSEIDLKCVGITKRLPFVYEKTSVMRLVDVLKSERHAIAALGLMAAACLFPRHALSPMLGMAISTYDGIINARTSSGKYSDSFVGKLGLTMPGARWYSYWKVGGFPVAGTYTNIPGGSAPDQTNTGAWSLGLTPPSGGDKAYLLSFGFQAAVNASGGALLLIDLLVEAGNISANNTLQTINSTALTRYTNGIGVMMTFECTTATTGTGTFDVSYTNDAGTAGQVKTLDFVYNDTSNYVSRLYPMTHGPFAPLVAGDKGVKSVQTFQSGGGHTSGGVFALNLYFPLTFVPLVMTSPGWAERSLPIQVDGLVELQVSSGVLGCLAGYMLGATTTGAGLGRISTVRG